MKINVGCGNRVLPGYENLDLYVKHPGVTRMDVRCLPYHDGTIDEVLAEDIIEHFSRLEWKKVLAEWVRVLKPGGVIRLQFPEMRELADALLHADTDERWEWLTRRIFGDQAEQGMWHFHGLTVDYLRRHLENVHGLVYVFHEFDGNYNVVLVMRKP